MLIRKRPIDRAHRRGILIAGFALGCLLSATCVPIAAFAADNSTQATSPNTNTPPTANTSPDDNAGLQAEESDPLEPFNSAMFTFNLKVDDYVLHPVASGYAKVVPQGGREAIGRALDNVRVIPRFANNAFQLRIPQAGTEVARFGINTTVGLLGLFDPADKWFGLKEHPDDFGLTLRYYHVPTGPYLMIPFFGPSTVSDAVGRVADGFMNPLSYFVPWYVSLAATGGQTIVEAVNYRSLHLDQFEQADRYAIDLYGAVQDAYLQDRDNRVKELHSGAD
ncbi:MAG TPA: VacJ family lipoprotein [Candidatus Binataceae bacterium]|nr:VacJ family lipoprotein [Candidatus Binataceae bacterium]